ncbi:transcriptional regulator SplA domain-containing protein [Jeotgalibacillus proteolyticus]|uniref:Transcriptional regulator n=1 Tax=Jeotgalibacillus proteolyticus TaxID=2082395 RepID=A0A2S5GBU3_9BACL|nr:transcriptional regulator SplA domain-containing protein [Jeotgalibacillus proteolyticus]PPA70384.1 transcriptional regulator [Jeotgalibacillus proteolyticus]
MIDNESFSNGEVVYVIMRNPHAQGVANIHEASVVVNPDDAERKFLYMHDSYYPLTEEVAVYASHLEADSAYRAAFGEDLHG